MDWSHEVLMFNNMQSPVYVLLFSGIDLYNYRKVMFSHASVHGWMGGYVWSLVPGYRRYTTRRYSPQKVTSPERYAAQNVHPSGRYTPPEGTPLRKVHLRSADIEWWLPKRVVRILLEYFSQSLITLIKVTRFLS